MSCSFLFDLVYRVRCHLLDVIEYGYFDAHSQFLVQKEQRSQKDLHGETNGILRSSSWEEM